MNPNYEFARALGLAGGAISSCAKLSFLFRVVPRFVLLPNSYMATKTRSNIDAALPREGKLAICSADDAASLSEACRTDSLLRWIHSRTSFSHFRTFSFSICLDLSLSPRVGRRYAKSSRIHGNNVSDSFCNFRLRILWFLYSCMRVFRVPPFIVYYRTRLIFMSFSQFRKSN